MCTCVRCYLCKVIARTTVRTSSGAQSLGSAPISAPASHALISPVVTASTPLLIVSRLALVTVIKFYVICWAAHKLLDNRLPSSPARAGGGSFYSAINSSDLTIKMTLSNVVDGTSECAFVTLLVSYGSLTWTCSSQKHVADEHVLSVFHCALLEAP